MDPREVSQMAEQAGFGGVLRRTHAVKLEIFAKLVAEKEREACAKVCDSLASRLTYAPLPAPNTQKGSVQIAADSIRSRG